MLHNKIIFTLSLVTFLVLTLTFCSFTVLADQNLAPLNDEMWHSDSSWNVVPADNIYTETNSANMHNGAPTWRMQTGPSLAADHDWGVLAVKAGDHIVLSVWVKTSGSSDSVLGRSGATVGMDMYTGNYGGTWARIGPCNSPGFIAIKGNIGAYGYPSDSATWMVPWGSNWVQKTFDFIMPDKWTGDGASSMGSNQVSAGTQVPVQYICPWLQISANYGSTSGTYTTWFSDFQLYITSGSNQPTSPPSPSPTPTVIPSNSGGNSGGGTYIQSTPTPTPHITPQPTPVKTVGYTAWILNNLKEASYNILHPTPTPVPKAANDPTAISDILIIFISLALVSIITKETKRRRRKKHC